jgi:hypothetical protein
MVTGWPSTDPTYNGFQAESNVVVSNLTSNQAVAIVSYNDDTTDQYITYPLTKETDVYRNASQMGFSWVKYDPTQSFASVGAWKYGGKLRPPTGWGAIWTDNSMTVSQKKPKYAFLTNLAVPSSAFPPGNNKPVKVVYPNVFDQLGGACIARLTVDWTNGVTAAPIAAADCFSAPPVGTAANFYDGSSMASTADGAIYAAYDNVGTGGIDVYEATSETATFTKIANPFPGLTSMTHPRLRAATDGTNRLYLATLTQPTGAQNPVTSLSMNVWDNSTGRWATASTVASAGDSGEPFDGVVGSITTSAITSGLGTTPAQNFRTNGMVSFDVGRPSKDSTGNARSDSIRVAVSESSNGISGPYHVAMFACSDTSGAISCSLASAWGTSTLVPLLGAGLAGQEWEPEVKATLSSGSASDPMWVLTTRRMSAGNNQVASVAWALHVGSDGTRSASRLGGFDGVPWFDTTPCPMLDARQYWGDYNDVAVASETFVASDGNKHPYFFGTETNSMIPANITGGSATYCNLQEQYRAYMHVAVNMFTNP